MRVYFGVLHLEEMATNNNQWPKERMIPRKAVGGADTEVLSNLVNHVAQLTKQLQRQQGAVNAIQDNPWEICESCGGQHRTTEYQLGQMTVEHAHYVSRFNQNQQQSQYGGNTYQNQNQNYGWRNNQNSMSLSQVSKPLAEKKIDLEEALAQMLTSHTTFMNETKANLQNQST